MEPGRIEDDDAVGRGRHEPGEPELTERSRHDLSDRPDRVGQLLLGDPGNQTALRSRLHGREIQQVRGDALLDRAERVDRRLLEGVVQPVAQLLGQRERDPRVNTRDLDQCPRVEVEQARRDEGLRADVERPPTTSGIPRTSPLRAYRTVTCLPSGDAR